MTAAARMRASIVLLCVWLLAVGRVMAADETLDYLPTLHFDETHLPEQVLNLLADIRTAIDHSDRTELDATTVKAVALCETLQDEDVQAANCFIAVGNVYQSNGLFKAALDVHQRALKSLLTLVDAKGPDAVSGRYLAQAYNLVGFSHEQLKMPRAALEELHSASSIETQEGAPESDSIRSMTNILLGHAYRSIGKHPEAANAFAAALSGIGNEDISGRFALLALRAEELLHADDLQGAETAYQEAVTVAGEGSDAEWSRLPYLLLAEASVYLQTGENNEAVELILSAKEHQALDDDPWFDIKADITLAIADLNLARYQSAIERLTKARTVLDTLPVDYPEMRRSILSNLGSAHLETGEYQSAIREYEAAAEGVDGVELSTEYNGLSLAYQHLRNYPMALRYRLRNMKILEENFPPTNRDRISATTALAGLSWSTQDYAKAEQLLRRSLLLASALTNEDGSFKYPEEVRTIAVNLGVYMESWPRGNRSDEAILYYKIGMEASEELRHRSDKLSDSSRQSLDEKLSDVYFGLARLLVKKGRFAEAENVILRLQDAEVAEFATRNGGRYDLTAHVNWSESEKQFAAELAESSSRIGREVESLEELRLAISRGSVSRGDPRFSQTIERLNRLVEIEERALGNAQRALSVHSGHEPSPDPSAQRSGLMNVIYTLRTKDDLKALQLPGSAAILWIPSSRGLTVALAIGDAFVASQEPYSKAQIAQAAAELREAIEHRGAYLEPAKALYKWLIKPALELLPARAGPVKHLMLVATGSLGDVPFAALFDESRGQFLVQEYSLSLVSGPSMEKLALSPTHDWKIAALGVTKAHPDFGNIALPGVQDELCGIVRSDQGCGQIQGVIPGEIFEDNQFDRKELTALLGVGNSVFDEQVIHLATHYNVQRSQLLLGTEVITLSQLFENRATLRLEKYELMTLSACDSATGTAGSESLAGLFQANGAQSVLATLWSVQDEGASKFMVEFYRIRGEHRQMSKAEALQAVQVEFIGGHFKTRDGDFEMTHPYYWAPFVLMGNWL